MSLLISLLLISLFSCPGAQSLGCQLQGTCTGVNSFVSTSDSYNQCLEHCKSNDPDTCDWITFNEQDKVCFGYYDCPSIDLTCEVCTTGERACHGGVPTAANVPLILTADISKAQTKSSGIPLNPNPFNRLVIGFNGEVINLSDDGGKCPFLNMPFKYHSYGTFLNGKLIICGHPEPSCYSLAGYGQDWKLVGELSPTRLSNGNVQMSDTEWWITGGASIGKNGAHPCQAL